MPTQTAQRVYAGMTATQRRAERRSRLLDAAIDVLASQGWERATVTAICERAGLIPRYFYESFRDREALLISVFDSIIDEVSEEIGKRATDDRSVEGLIRATIDAWLAVASRDPRKGRVAFVEALGSEALMQRRLDATHAYAELLLDRSISTPHRAGHSRAAVQCASLITAGGLIETMIEWMRGNVDLSADEIAENYTRLCTAAFRTAGGRGN
ncbi:MAG: TetR/AcrR family transcriptional regulator [Actinomycetota bacterium]|nr:TetR/AcrR family transcriptional regulator [Actinomycetota bacterium]